MKENNPLFYLPSSQLYPASIASGTIYSSDELLEKVKLAKHYVNNNHLQQALDLYNLLIEKNIKNPFLFACRSLLKLQMNEDEGAFYDYQVAKQLDFNYHHVLEWISHVGQMEESSELLNLIAHESEEEQYYINRATVYVEHYEYEKAIQDFTQAYFIGNNPIVLISRGAIYMRMTRYDMALLDFNKALKQDDSQVQGYIFRAKLYLSLHEFVLAELDFGKAISLSPMEVIGYEERAQFYESLQQYEQAIADYSKMISLEESDFYGYVLRADLLNKLDKKVEALADYDKAITLNPYYSDLYQYRGEIRQALGDEKGAQEDFSKFRELEDEE